MVHHQSRAIGGATGFTAGRALGALIGGGLGFAIGIRGRFYVGSRFGGVYGGYSGRFFELLFLAYLAYHVMFDICLAFLVAYDKVISHYL